jgi:hypothetical protein
MDISEIALKLGAHRNLPGTGSAEVRPDTGAHDSEVRRTYVRVRIAEVSVVENVGKGAFRPQKGDSVVRQNDASPQELPGKSRSSDGSRRSYSVRDFAAKPAVQDIHPD